MAYLIRLPAFGLAERFQKQLGSSQGSSALWFKCSYARWKHTRCIPSNTSQWDAFITIVCHIDDRLGFSPSWLLVQGFPLILSAWISFRPSVGLREARRLQAISVTRAHVASLQTVRGQFHRNTPPAAVRILLRIVAKRIQMR